MSRKDELLQALQNPNVRAFLDMLAEAEGVRHGYNTGFGNTVIESLADHPRERKPFTETTGKRNETTAAGRYQFLEDTWDDVAKKLGLRDFGPESQDLAAVELLKRNGALPAILAGDFNTAVERSGKTWASLPSSPYAQPKKSAEFIASRLPGYNAQGQSPAEQVRDLTLSPAMQALLSAQGSAPVPAVTPPLRAEEPVVSASDPNAIQKALELMAPQPTALLDEPAMDEDLMTPQDEQLLADGLQADTRRMRQEAQAKFFGEDYVPDVELPPEIDDSINRYLAML